MTVLIQHDVVSSQVSGLHLVRLELAAGVNDGIEQIPNLTISTSTSL